MKSRRHTIIFHLAYFLLSMCFIACGSGNSYEIKEDIADTSSETRDTAVVTDAHVHYILFFGNSLTAGYGLDEEEAFPALIQQRIDSLGMPYQVINGGLSGETSAGGLGRIDWVLRQRVDVFVLELGANDALRGFSTEATEENLRGILQRVRSRYPDVRLVIAGMLAPPNLGTDYTTAFERIFPALAAEFDAALIPFLLEGVAADPALNLADGIHPNVEGHRVLRENVWEVLKEVL